jgi:predicted nucleotidyltransferase
MSPERKPRQPGKIPVRWHQAILEKQARRENLRLRLLDQIKSALTELEKKYDWTHTYVFGSVAQKGKFTENSDIDIAIEGLNKLDHYRFIGDISEHLNRRVDVVLLEECPFAESIKGRGLKCRPRTGF